MDSPLGFLSARIDEIERQCFLCELNNCDAEEVRRYLLEFKYAYKLLKDFGFVPKKGPRNNTRKLSCNDIKNIRKYYNADAGKYSPYSSYGLAFKYDVSYHTILRVINYDTWKEVV